jgi:hypothetical protein
VGDIATQIVVPRSVMNAPSCADMLQKMVALEVKGTPLDKAVREKGVRFDGFVLYTLSDLHPELAACKTKAEISQAGRALIASNAHLTRRFISAMKFSSRDAESPAFAAKLNDHLQRAKVVVGERPLTAILGASFVELRQASQDMIGIQKDNLRLAMTLVSLMLPDQEGGWIPGDVSEEDVGYEDAKESAATSTEEEKEDEDKSSVAEEEEEEGDAPVVHRAPPGLLRSTPPHPPPGLFHSTTDWDVPDEFEEERILQRATAYSTTSVVSALIIGVAVSYLLQVSVSW